MVIVQSWKEQNYALIMNFPVSANFFRQAEFEPISTDWLKHGYFINSIMKKVVKDLSMVRWFLNSKRISCQFLWYLSYLCKLHHSQKWVLQWIEGLHSLPPTQDCGVVDCLRRKIGHFHQFLLSVGHLWLYCHDSDRTCFRLPIFSIKFKS